MKSNKTKSQQQLLTIIHQQQDEIIALRARVEALEAEDVGELRCRVEELENWKAQAEEQIRQLETKAAMTQGLVVFAGTSAVALLGQKVFDVVNALPIDKIIEALDELSDEELTELEEKIGKEKLAELDEQFGNLVAKVIQTIQRIDKMSLVSWQRQWVNLEKRVATLPPLKRAMFEALKRFAAPSKMGTLIVKVMLTSPDVSEKLTPENKHKIELLASVFDTLTNLWPLTITNSLAPMLKHVGFDDAAEAAGEILDQLEITGKVPRHLVHKVRRDLIAEGAIEERTKPITIIEYFKHGYRLQRLGYSPDEAAEFGRIHSSASQLKRAKRAYEALQNLYNRTCDLPEDISLDNLESFAQAFKRIAEEKVEEMRGMLTAELV